MLDDIGIIWCLSILHLGTFCYYEPEAALGMQQVVDAEHLQSDHLQK